MSDNRPPGAEKNVTDLPEEIIRMIFIPLSLVDLMSAGQVCKMWNTVQKGICLTKKSLILLVNKRTKLDWLRPRKNNSRFCMENVLDEDGKPMVADTLERDFEYNGVKFNKLTVAKIISLQKTFMNATEITIGCCGATTVLLNHMKRLLTKFGPKLVVLKLNFTHDDLPEENQMDLFDTINALPKLKHLGLKILAPPSIINNTDLPILSQLEQFEYENYLSAERSRTWIQYHWTPYIEKRDGPLQIAYINGHVDDDMLVDMPPKVAAMFTRIPDMYIDNFPEFSRFTTKFSNLVQLQTGVPNVPVPQLLVAFSSLKLLVALCIDLYQPTNVGHAADDVLVLPQLPSVKLFSLSQCLTTSHGDIAHWNLGWTMPNLQLLDINCYFSFNTKCSDCNFDGKDYEPVKQCLCIQLRTLKQQCQQLRDAKMKCQLGSNTTINLEDIDD